jgi:hypothetical protein
VFVFHSLNARGHMSDQAVENVLNKAAPKKDTKIEKPSPKKAKRVIDEEVSDEEEAEHACENGDGDLDDDATTINKFKQLHNRVGQVFRVMANGKNRKRNRVVLVPFNGCPNCRKL